jgi:hypothetical protein
MNQLNECVYGREPASSQLNRLYNELDRLRVENKKLRINANNFDKALEALKEVAKRATTGAGGYVIPAETFDGIPALIKILETVEEV